MNVCHVKQLRLKINLVILFVFVQCIYKLAAPSEHVLKDPAPIILTLTYIVKIIRGDRVAQCE